MSQAGTTWQRAEVARAFVDERRAAIPYGPDQVRMMLQLVEHFRPRPRWILDLGCGDGILARVVLETYPAAAARQFRPGKVFSRENAKGRKREGDGKGGRSRPAPPPHSCRISRFRAKGTPDPRGSGAGWSLHERGARCLAHAAGRSALRYALHRPHGGAPSETAGGGCGGIPRPTGQGGQHPRAGGDAARVAPRDRLRARRLLLQVARVGRVRRHEEGERA